MIRDMQKQDIKRIVDIWLSASILAHDFIEYSYWHNKVGKLLYELSSSKGYVYTKDDLVIGFLSMWEFSEGQAYINGLFIDPRHQGRKYGSELLAHAKGLYTSLELHVYQLNKDAVKFYTDRDFGEIGRKSKERETGQIKLNMTWPKHSTSATGGSH